jgi:hypothetical protein|tara:strand:- start:186 stop:482 length:297 start_codon:yes stop_codon:yes gene_type:complete
MRKISIALAVGVSIILVGAGAGAVYSYNSCGYNVFTGHYVSDGKEYAYGTLDDAYACALFGLLPDFVEQRLGKYGDKDAQRKAKDIIETNNENKGDKK